jgi:hypothetical protein
MIMTIRTITLLSTILFFGCQEEGISPDSSTNGETDILVAIDPTVFPSEEETASLQFMREEEKLARDVYLTLYDVYGLRPFSNIASSEQKHTDAIATLMDAYEIADPVTEDIRGEFLNEFLAVTYLELVDKGSIDVIEALKVGALIEELDILDLREASNIITHPSILGVYASLEKGSRNHLRSYYANLINRGVNYQPQLMEEDDFFSIVNTDRETGN